MIRTALAFCIFLFCAIEFYIPFLYAQELKLGVFDMQKIMKESKTVANYRKDIFEKIELKRKPIQEKDEFAKAINEKLKKDGSNMPFNDRKALEEKFVNEIKEIRRMKEDLDAETIKYDRELSKNIFLEIDKIIKNIAEQEDYTVIFENTAAGIAHYQNSVDITGKILEKLK